MSNENVEPAPVHCLGGEPLPFDEAQAEPQSYVRGNRAVGRCTSNW
jgi:hypothetical protein